MYLLIHVLVLIVVYPVYVSNRCYSCKGYKWEVTKSENILFVCFSTTVIKYRPNSAASAIVGANAWKNACSSYWRKSKWRFRELVTTNQIINVYGFLVVMLLMYFVLHCLYSVGNKITTTSHRVLPKLLSSRLLHQMCIILNYKPFKLIKLWYTFPWHGEKITPYLTVHLKSVSAYACKVYMTHPNTQTYKPCTHMYKDSW